ncbi:hypothetical protein MN0502_07260 [Arthrobacter sp. MN05-02]|nr:hypothetical protein MN0502_07260 [Arthrobacter sp. MN05-02]
MSGTLQQLTGGPARPCKPDPAVLHQRCPETLDERRLRQFTSGILRHPAAGDERYRAAAGTRGAGCDRLP